LSSMNCSFKEVTEIIDFNKCLNSLKIFLTTHQGHLLLAKFGSFHLETLLPNQIESLYFHTSQINSNKDDSEGYILVGSVDSKIFIFSVKQLLNKSGTGLFHVLNLYHFENNPIIKIVSHQHELFACSKSNISHLRFKDKREPAVIENIFIQSKIKSKKLEENYLLDVFISKNILLTNTKTELVLWKSEPCLMSFSILNIQNSFSTMKKIFISSLAFDKMQQNIWVGTNTGHILLYKWSFLGFQKKPFLMIKRFGSNITKLSVISSKQNRFLLCIGNKLMKLQDDLFADLKSLQTVKIENGSDKQHAVLYDISSC